jgi:hypothetical protein
MFNHVVNGSSTGLVGVAPRVQKQQHIIDDIVDELRHVAASRSPCVWADHHLLHTDDVCLAVEDDVGNPLQIGYYRRSRAECADIP